MMSRPEQRCPSLIEGKTEAQPGPSPYTHMPRGKKSHGVKVGNSPPCSRSRSRRRGTSLAHSCPMEPTQKLTAPDELLPATPSLPLNMLKLSKKEDLKD